MTEPERSDAELANVRRELADLRENLHYLMGTCELAFTHRDFAEKKNLELEARIASQAAEIARLTERAEFAENQMGERIAAVERAGASRMREQAAQVALTISDKHCKLARDLWKRPGEWKARAAEDCADEIATAIAALPLDDNQPRENAEEK